MVGGIVFGMPQKGSEVYGSVLHQECGRSKLSLFAPSLVMVKFEEEFQWSKTLLQGVKRGAKA